MTDESATTTAGGSQEVRVVQVPARSGALVPVLLTVLTLAVLAVGALLALPYFGVKLSFPGTQPEEEQPDLLADLDPDLLVTPSGRRLECVQFGGRVFEITRIAWNAASPKQSFVSITVPGKPPRQGIYHMGEGFDGGRIRVREIGRDWVALECEGEQQTFPVLGADPDAVWNPESRSESAAPGGGTTFLPAKDMGSSSSMIPESIPGATGRVRAPRDPREETADSGEESETPATMEDLPDYRVYLVPRDEYREMLADLASLFVSELVLMPALEPDTRTAWGLEVKNLLPDARLTAYGLQKGDVIARIGTQFVRSHEELDDALVGQDFRNSMEIAVCRGEEVFYIVFEAE